MPHRAPGSPGNTRQHFLSGRPIRYYRPTGGSQLRHLIDEGFDAVVVEAQGFHEIDGLVAQLVEAAFLAGREFVGAERGFDARVLQFAELLIKRGDLIEGREHLRLQGRFHRREREIALVVEIVVGAADAFAALTAFADPAKIMFGTDHPFFRPHVPDAALEKFHLKNYVDQKTLNRLPSYPDSRRSV